MNDDPVEKAFAFFIRCASVAILLGCVSFIVLIVKTASL